MFPVKLRMVKADEANLKDLTWNGHGISLHLPQLPPLFHPAVPPLLPLPLPPPTPPAFTRASPRTIGKQPLMRLGGISCLPPKPHLPGYDFARWKINHSHSVPGHCPQGAETSSPPPLEPACNMGLSGTKRKTFRDPHPIWRAKRVSGKNC